MLIGWSVFGSFHYRWIFGPEVRKNAEKVGQWTKSHTVGYEIRDYTPGLRIEMLCSQDMNTTWLSHPSADTPLFHNLNCALQDVIIYKPMGKLELFIGSLSVMEFDLDKFTDKEKIVVRLSKQPIILYPSSFTALTLKTTSTKSKIQLKLRLLPNLLVRETIILSPYIVILANDEILVMISGTSAALSSYCGKRHDFLRNAQHLEPNQPLKTTNNNPQVQST